MLNENINTRKHLTFFCITFQFYIVVLLTTSLRRVVCDLPRALNRLRVNKERYLASWERWLLFEFGPGSGLFPSWSRAIPLALRSKDWGSAELGDIRATALLHKSCFNCLPQSYTARTLVYPVSDIRIKVVAHHGPRASNTETRGN